MSITDELRAWVRDGKGSLLAIADRIDAEHQKAEDEWKAKDGQSWLYGYGECHAQLMEGNEAIAADLEGAGWVRLPKDADGVPIHIGDVMDGTCPSGKHVNGTVNAIGDGVFWLSNVQFSLKPDYMHHYHAPTVEDVLREFGDWYAHTKGGCDEDGIIADYAAKLQLAGDAAGPNELALAYHVGYDDALAKRKPDASKVAQR